MQWNIAFLLRVLGKILCGPLTFEAQDEAAYFAENKEIFLQKVEEHGAVVLRGFESTKEPMGFEAMWKGIGMEVRYLLFVSLCFCVKLRVPLSWKFGIYFLRLHLSG